MFAENHALNDKIKIPIGLISENTFVLEHLYRFLTEIFISVYRTLKKSGSYNVTKLLPWRLYRFNLTAVSDEHNLTDSLHKDAGTPEDGKIIYN
jgi:hypothetical protein